MYKDIELMKYEYFFNTLEKEKIESILDPLTGLILKGRFLRFIDSLIHDDIPFTMGILDIDNFKFIVDNYGHYVGDEILSKIGNELKNYIGDNGLVGRFGGDEFIFVIFDLIEYDDVHEFLRKMYVEVLRKTVKISGLSILVTATTGTASYPTNAKTTSDLFDLADKTLFRGKMKGRNCYIIYVEEKHKDIKIPPIDSGDIFKIIFEIKSKFESQTKTLADKLLLVTDFLKLALNIPYIFHVDTAGNITNAENEAVIGKITNRIELNKYNIYEINGKNDLSNNMELYDAFVNLDIESLLLTEIDTKSSFRGYIIFADTKEKYFTPNEKTALFYLAELISEE